VTFFFSLSVLLGKRRDELARSLDSVNKVSFSFHSSSNVLKSRSNHSWNTASRKCVGVGPSHAVIVGECSRLEPFREDAHAAIVPAVANRSEGAASAPVVCQTAHFTARAFGLTIPGVTTAVDLAITCAVWVSGSGSFSALAEFFLTCFSPESMRLIASTLASTTLRVKLAANPAVQVARQDVDKHWRQSNKIHHGITKEKSKEKSEEENKFSSNFY